MSVSLTAPALQGINQLTLVPAKTKLQVKMTFSFYLILLLAAYFFYYLVVIALDKIPAKKGFSTTSSSVDFVFTQAENPTRIMLDESLRKYMPLVEDEPETLASESTPQEDAEYLQDLMRMETYSDIAPEEIDGEELAMLMI